MLHAKGKITLNVQQGNQPMKSLRHNAGDGDGKTVINNCFVDDAGVAAQARLPEGIAENDNRIQSSHGALGRKNEPAKERPNAKSGEEVAANIANEDGFGFSIQREAASIDVHSHHVGKDRRGLLLKVLEFRIGKGSLKFAFFELHGQHCDLLRAFHWERAEQEGIDHAENCGVCADAEA